MKNVAYDQDNNFLQTIAGTGLVVGAGIAIHQYHYNNEGFNSALRKARDIVQPRVAITGNAHIDQLTDVREHIDAASMIQRSHHSALVSQRHRKDAEKMEGMDQETAKKYFSKAARDKLTEEARKEIDVQQHRFKFQNGLNDITDIYGNKIGHHFNDAFEALGFDVDSVSFSGTTGTFSTKHKVNGATGEVKIRFGKYDERTGAWLASTGGTDYVTKRAIRLTDGGGHLAASMMDPNTNVLLALQDHARLGYAASRNEEYVKEATKRILADGNKKGIDLITDLRGTKKVTDSKMLQFAIDKLQEEHEPITANSEKEMIRMSASMPTDLYDRKLLADMKSGIWNGLDRERVGATPGSMNSIPARVKGDALDQLFGLGQAIKEDSRKLSVTGIGDDGKALTLSLEQAAEKLDNATRRSEAQRTRDAATQFGATGSGGKVSNVTFDIYPDMAATQQAERMKSMKTPKYMGKIVEGSGGFVEQDLAKMGFEGLNLDASAIEKLRTRLLMVRPDSFNGAASSYRDVLRAQEAERGSVNFFGVLTPWLSDSVSIESTVSKQMSAVQEVQATVNQLLTGDKAKEFSRAEAYIYNPTTKALDLDKHVEIIADLLDDSFAERFLSNEKNRIFIKEGTIMGLLDNVGQVMTSEDLTSATESQGRVLRSKADQIITRDDYLLMRARNEREFIKDSVTGNLMAQEEGGIKFYGRLHSNVTKIGLQESKTRGSVTSHMTTDRKYRSQANSSQELINDMLIDSGSKAEAEFHISSSLFEKTFATVKGDVIREQKNAAETLPALFNLLSGQIFSSIGGSDIIVEGEAANDLRKNLTVTGYEGRKFNSDSTFGEFNSTLQRFSQGDKLNLTNMMASGELAWNPKTANMHEAAKQMEEITSLFGQIRHNSVNGISKNISSLAVNQNGTDYGEILSKHIDLVTNSKMASANLFNGEEISSFDDVYARIQKAKADGSINKKALAEMTFSHFGGWNPNEIMHLAQGAGFNNMRIPIKNMGAFQNKPEILSELIKNSETDSQLIMEQMSLMTNSLNSDTKSFKTQLDSYSEKYGASVNILEGEDILERFGNHMISNDYIANLKDANTDVFKESMFSRESNPFGFVVRSKKGELAFIPGADVWGGATYLGDKERLTFRDFGMDALRLVRDAAIDKNGASEKAFNQFRSSFLVETSASSGGPLLEAGIKAKGGLYSQHVFDLEMLHNTDFKLALNRVGNEELKEMFGNTMTVSRKDYASLIEQEIKDAVDISRHSASTDRPLTTRAAMIEKQGEKGFLVGMDLGGLEDLDREALGKKINKMVSSKTMEMTEWADAWKKSVIKIGVDPHTPFTPEMVAKHINMDSMTGVSIRWPMLGRSSASIGFIMPDTSWDGRGQKRTVENGLMERKQIALGEMIALNQNADFDGDKIAVKALFSNESRIRTATVIRQQQAETSRITKMMKERNMWKSVQKAVEPHVIEQTSILGTLASGGASRAIELTKSMFEIFPKSTALSMYMTKSMTGAFNVHAMGAKSWLGAQTHGKSLTEQELEKVMNYVETFPSLMTEQQVISSKHLELFLDKQGHTVDNMGNITKLFDNVNTGDMRQVIRDSGGDMHPVVKAMVSKHRGTSQEIDDLYKQMANLEDIQSGTRSFWNPSDNVNRETDFKSAVSLKYEKEEDINKAWGAYKHEAELHYADGKKFLFEEDAFKKMGWSGETQLGLMNKAINANHSDTSAMAGDSLMSFLLKTGGAIKEGKFDEVLDEAAPWLRRSQIGQALEMNLSEGGQIARSSIRKLRGQASVEKIISWIAEAPGRRGGVLGAGAMLGLAAMNIMSGGDGTPQDPNDLPSVNNPSFTNRRTGHAAGRYTMDNSPNTNTSVDLLTDSSVHYDSAMGRINTSGYNNVSVRHDGTDPYRSDMYHHTN